MDIERITNKQKEYLMLYGIYTILYINDTACFSIQQLNKDVMCRDKESKKVYNALRRRCHAYLMDIEKIIGEDMDGYVAYCTEMDDICNNTYVEFKESLMNAYKNANIEDCEYLSKVETMRSIVGLSVETCINIAEKIQKYNQKAKAFEKYALLDIQRVANNFATWSYRNVPKDARIELGKESKTVEIFNRLSELLVDYNSFEKSYLKS